MRSSTVLAKYQCLVADAVFPDPLSSRRISLRDANAAIAEYRRSTGDLDGTVDLMVTFIEAGTEQSADLGYGDDNYFSALERKLDAVAKSWPDVSRMAQMAMAKRLFRIRGSGTEHRVGLRRLRLRRHQASESEALKVIVHTDKTRSNMACSRRRDQESPRLKPDVDMT